MSRNLNRTDSLCTGICGNNNILCLDIFDALCPVSIHGVVMVTVHIVLHHVTEYINRLLAAKLRVTRRVKKKEFQKEKWRLRVNINAEAAFALLD